MTNLVTHFDGKNHKMLVKIIVITVWYTVRLMEMGVFYAQSKDNKIVGSLRTWNLLS